MAEQESTPTTQGIGCGMPLKGCSIFIVAVGIALILMLVYMSQREDIQNLVACQRNMTEVGQAIIRYHTVTNRYPESLEDLKKEYLQTPKYLYCPADQTANQASYIYHTPPDEVGSDFVMLECRHHIMDKKNVVTPVVTLDGKWMMDKHSLGR